MNIMTCESAMTLIAQKANIVYVKYWFDNMFLVYFKYDENLLPKLRENIPSIKYISMEKAYKVHYFDLKDFFNFMGMFGYKIVVDENFGPAIKKIKDDFLEKEEWKIKPMVQISGLKRELKSYQLLGAQYMFRS